MIRNFKATLPLLLAVWVFCTVAFAYADDKNAANANHARDFVNRLSDRVFGIIKAGHLSDHDKQQKLMSMFKDYVDTDWMGTFVMGRYYRTIDGSQQKRYLRLYHEYLIRSYIPKFNEYGARPFDVVRVVEKEDGEFLVQTKFDAEENLPEVQVDYRLRQDSEQKFQVIDITGEGISLITTQRSDFGGLISRKGAAYFINKLEDKVNQLRDTQKAEKETATAEVTG